MQSALYPQAAPLGAGEVTCLDGTQCVVTDRERLRKAGCVAFAIQDRHVVGQELGSVLTKQPKDRPGLPSVRSCGQQQAVAVQLETGGVKQYQTTGDRDKSKQRFDDVRVQHMW